MSRGAYAIGVDFGTESGRALLLDARSGEELAVSVVPYPSGVIDRTLPDSGERLPPDWALQDPDDWVAVIEQALPECSRRRACRRDEVGGIGVDFTSCTVLPVTAEGVPLCTLEPWRTRRHAWPKLWKHHAAQPVADRLNGVALERGEDFLNRYGGRISSEWYFPKLIEVWLEDREVYDAAARLHRGHRLDRLVVVRGGAAPELHRRLQGALVGSRGPAARRVLRRRLPRLHRAGGEARNRVRPAGHASGRAPRRARGAARASRHRRRCRRQRRLVRVAAGRRRRAAGHAT